MNTTRYQPAIDEPPIAPPKRPAGSNNTNLYRSPARVGILSFIGFLTYPIWWALAKTGPWLFGGHIAILLYEEARKRLYRLLRRP